MILKKLEIKHYQLLKNIFTELYQNDRRNKEAVAYGTAAPKLFTDEEIRLNTK